MGWTHNPGLVSPRRYYGVQDFNDAATAITPVQLTAAGTWYDLPNDGLGALSSQASAVLGHGPLFNTSTGEFDFSDLSLMDMIKMRIDVEFTTTSPNTDVSLRIVFGPSFAFALQLLHDGYRTVVSGSEGEELPYIPFQMKTLDTLNNPAKLQARTDGGGDSVIVNGWQLETNLLS